VLSTSRPVPPPARTRRALLAAGAATALGGCAASFAPPDAAPARAAAVNDVFVMADGTRLPYRSWLPAAAAPDAVVLALHGFNDSRDAWEIPAIDFTAAGLAVYAPDQRGFGQAPGRGLWPGTRALVADAAEIAGQLRRRHPGARLVLLGESMGGAVLMCLATSRHAPAGASYVLVAPAVWGRATMNLFLRGGLWLASTLVPALAVSGAPVRVTASDNHAALVRLSRDPLTIHATRFDTLRGLVDLMDAALAAAPAFTAPGLFLYGGRDELVPKGAMAAMWRQLPPGGARAAYYPRDYHLMLRDLGRAAPVGDVVAWLRDPLAPLPSGADHAAAEWLCRQA
jgi:alpha-beta hydrolase superfamily lysophospholipase